MKEHDNEQWDDQYPLLEHFEEDIAKDYLYVLEENNKIYGFIACSFINSFASSTRFKI
jgi:hypothetical protein